MSSDFLASVQALTESDVLRIGALREEIVRQWTDQTVGNEDIVLTGKQRAHYLARHPETAALEALLEEVISEPDEPHRNRSDPAVAILYKRISSRHYVRVAVLMQPIAGRLKHSVLSYRLAGWREVARTRGGLPGQQNSHLVGLPPPHLFWPGRRVDGRLSTSGGYAENIACPRDATIRRRR